MINFYQNKMHRIYLGLTIITTSVLLTTILSCGSGGSGGGGSGGGSSGTTTAQYLADLATVPTRQANHGYPRLAIDTQVSWDGNSANGYLGKSLFSRLHWFDYAIVDGNVTVPNPYTVLGSYIGMNGSIRAINPNFVSVAYMSVADFDNDPGNPGILYSPLQSTYAGGFDTANWLYYDASHNPIKLWQYGDGWYSHIPDPNKTGFQQYFVSTVNAQIVENKLVDGIYHDWGGCSEIPNLGFTTSVSLLNNGVNNLVSTTNINDLVNVDWQNGLTALYTLGKATYPTHFIMTGNSGWGGQPTMFTAWLQGTQLEDFLNSVASSVGWQGAMYTYATFALNGQTPNFAFIQADISFTPGNSLQDANHMLYDLMVSSGNTWITTAQLTQLRFGLASALMFNGYYATSNTNATGGGYTGAYWLDEYAVNASGTAVVPTDATASAARAAKGWLGSPLAAAYNVAAPGQTLWSVLSTGPTNAANTSVWRRDFTNGIVLVNPTGSAVNNINLGGMFKKINGVIDPAFNNGATGLTTISLPSHTGIVLHR
jgi:Hypothetical glycosyl hydrolase family 15